MIFLYLYRRSTSTSMIYRFDAPLTTSLHFSKSFWLAVRCKQDRMRRHLALPGAILSSAARALCQWTHPRWDLAHAHRRQIQPMLLIRRLGMSARLKSNKPIRTNETDRDHTIINYDTRSNKLMITLMIHSNNLLRSSCSVPYASYSRRTLQGDSPFGIMHHRCNVNWRRWIQHNHACVLCVSMCECARALARARVDASFFIYICVCFALFGRCEIPINSTGWVLRRTPLHYQWLKLRCRWWHRSWRRSWIHCAIRALCVALLIVITVTV